MKIFSLQFFTSDALYELISLPQRRKIKDGLCLFNDAIHEGNDKCRRLIKWMLTMMTLNNVKLRFTHGSFQRLDVLINLKI